MREQRAWAEQEAFERLRLLKREAEERRCCAEEAKRRHNESLQQELVRMTSQWRKAERLRAFLAAVQRSLPESDMNEAFVEWLD